MISKTNSRNLVLTTLVLLMTFACKKHNSVTGPDSGKKDVQIGSEGGEVASSDSSAILFIPPGALSSDIIFSFKKISGSNPSGSIGTVWNIGPNGTQFDTAAVLSLKYNPSDLPDSINAGQLRLATVANSKWDTLTSVSDTNNHRVHGLIHHLSEYGIISLPKENSYPSISDIKPDSGMVGDTVMIYGNDFGTDASKVRIGFNETQSSLLSLSDTQIKTIVPNGATTGPVRLIVDGNGVQGPDFTVQTPSASNFSITDVEPDSGKAGTDVTITGTGFGTDQSKIQVGFGYTQAQIQNLSNTQIKTTV
ncbi:MAG TPA: IPT/TIG domain-containing protein, partial [Balneolaceae bacterium]|nr:IPT/TIG domain-containing protein [Balneolaceae bacterium]